MMMKFDPFRTAAWLASTALLLCACAPPRSPAQVTVRNATAEDIVELTIDVSKQHLAARNVPPGGAATFKYSIGVESDYHVVAKFVSGQTLDRSVGYVDAGLNSQDSLTVYAGHIDFQPQP